MYTLPRYLFPTNLQHNDKENWREWKQRAKQSRSATPWWYRSVSLVSAPRNICYLSCISLHVLSPVLNYHLFSAYNTLSCLLVHVYWNIIISSNCLLPLAAGMFTVLTSTSQNTAHTPGGVAAESDKRLLPDKIRTLTLVMPKFKPLKSNGHVMHHQFNIQQLYVLPTLYLCVLCLSENKQRLVPLTA